MSADPLEPEQVATARRQVEQALADGAVGLSSGLDYLPSRFGAAGEIAEMARPLADANRPYVSHLRAYGSGVGEGLNELIAVGLRAGIRVHASHLWGAPADIQPAIDAADAAGVQVTFDMYPYRKSSTILAMLLLPSHLQAHGPEHTIAALKNPAERAALLASASFSEESLSNLYLGCLPDDYEQYAGLSITEAASGNRKPAGEWVLDLLADTDLNVGAHLDRPTLAEDHLTWLADHRRHCAGSDGIYQGQHPHPRSHGTFARLAQHYLNRNPANGHQQLARHLATNAADAYGLTTRGRLAPGKAADLSIISAHGLTDRATYEAPTRAATSLARAFIDGVTVWRDGRALETGHAGRLIDH